MAMHTWNGSSWVTVNQNTQAGGDRGLAVWDGGSWLNASNAKVWNGSAWKGFLDNVSFGGVSAQATGFGLKTCVFEMYTSGVWGYTQGATGNIVYGAYNWLANSDNASQYEIIATQTSGTTVIGTLNTWVSFPASWYIQDTSDASAVLAISIRHATTQTLLVDSASVSLSIVSFE